MEHLKEDINLIRGKKVTYSRTGGGASSILLVIFDNKCAVWAWRYWEINKGDELIACAEDDDTPVTGVMAVAARLLEGTVMEDLYFDESTLHLGMFFDNGYELWLYPELEDCDEFKSLCNWEYQIPTKNLCYEITSQLEIVTRNYY